MVWFVKGCHHGDRTVERQAPIIKRAVTAVQISANIDVLMGTMTKAVCLTWPILLKDARYVHRMQLVLMQQLLTLAVT